MTHEVCWKMMAAETIAENAVVEPRKMRPYSWKIYYYRAMPVGWEVRQTVMTVPLRRIAFRGILNVGLTCLQMLEYGRVLSRETAHNVREHVVPNIVS